MSTILNDKPVSIKSLEQEVFKFFCEQACDYTKNILEERDKYIMVHRDKSRYRHKGMRKTSLKTVYGEVEFQRTLYQCTNEEGLTDFVYLLDEELGLNGLGLISPNLAEQMVNRITEMSYRECSKSITEMTGQSISPMGVWNVIQSLGTKVCDDERQLVAAHKKGDLSGSEEADVLFEEADGVYINLQDKDAKGYHQKKAEMKVAIAYKGWKETAKERFSLEGKVITAGFARSKEFQGYREANIASVYNLGETRVRLLNGDGATWIKKVQDKETVFQLDPYHKFKAVRKLITHKEASKSICKYLKACDIDGLFEYLEIYIDSLSDDEEIEKAERLHGYFTKNRDGLTPYQKRVKSMPEPSEGLCYRNMGAMENHIWSVIARRMKHNHTSWSIRGGNNLAKILAKKCSGKLHEVFEELVIPCANSLMEEDFIVSSTPRGIKETIGKGYEYPINGSLPSINSTVRGDGVRLRAIIGI